MIIRKPRTTPLELLSGEALLRRLPDRHPRREDVLTQHRMYDSGHQGEVNTEFFINTADLPPFHVYHNPRIAYAPGSCVQIDTLLVSRQLAIILEIKNMGGRSLYFKGDSGQLIQEKWDDTKEDYIEKVYDDPVEQARRQKSKLHIWQRTTGQPPIPIEHLAVMANTNPIIIFSEDYPDRHRVVKTSHLESRLQRILRANPGYTYTDAQLHALDNQILTAHTPFIPNLLKKHKITCPELIRGVFCPACPSTLLIRQSRSWQCPRCHIRFRSAEVLHSALRDYCLLMGPVMTQASFRQFMNIPEAQTASNILKNLGLPSIGNTKGKKYDLSSLLEPSIIPLKAKSPGLITK
ncbi:nuclease-related domain-containing protein [Alteribacter natronophilus]|uniref:nuclease-related domain-containing protein n=1 Tax=Alteribacter natronophilus TaxID=2583810 RepID=UPI00110E5156|nr:nuclease-related domain-containing protein [Alteribacter natronophilus]TMW72223.1 NERD domain-containing protein [Alteribacter natronophilus]